MISNLYNKNLDLSLGLNLSAVQISKEINVICGQIDMEEINRVFHLGDECLNLFQSTLPLTSNLLKMK